MRKAVLVVLAMVFIGVSLAQAGEKEDLQKKMKEMEAQANVVGEQIRGAAVLKDKAVNDLVEAQQKIEAGQKMIQTLQTQYQEAAKKLADLESKNPPEKPQDKQQDQE